jgi:hypothetical protein
MPLYTRMRERTYVRFMSAGIHTYYLPHASYAKPMPIAQKTFIELPQKAPRIRVIHTFLLVTTVNSNSNKS